MSNFISFIEEQKNRIGVIIKKSSQTLYLLDPSFQFHIFEYMPKTFTITTNYGSSNFNIEMLSDTSPVISDFISQNPQTFHYHLDINDNSNILSKFEQLYQGKLVCFTDSELPMASQITSSLDITCCPNFLQNVSFFLDEKESSENYVKIDMESFNDFLENYPLKTFTIITNKNTYKCNKYGVYSSSVIREYLSKNQSSSEYIYNYDDEFSEFQLICDLFNFQKVTLTVNNMNSLKEISDHLQIESISKKISNFIEKYDKIYEKIDKQQEIIDSIDQLFHSLYHIKEETVISVTSMICKSQWCQTEEDVQELAAFILQVANNDLLLHSYLADLLIELNQKSDNKNQLKKLIPFIVKKLFFSFGKTITNCSFVYNLVKRNVITKEELIEHLRELFVKIKMEVTPSFIRYSLAFGNDEESYDDDDEEDLIENDSDFEYNSTRFIFLWFFPEIIEMKLFCEPYINCDEDEFVPFLKTFLPDKIEDYKKMRDKGEPEDELTMSLRNDNVDKLQSIMSTTMNDSKRFVPFNIYEDFVPNGKTSYLNYAAAYGSIKCFKYLLLNHDKCDKSTFSFATYGGNTEIIKIVDNYNQESFIDDSENPSLKVKESDGSDYLIDDYGNFTKLLYVLYYEFDHRNSDLCKIIPSIMKHQNDIFDWILENKFTSNEINEELFNNFLIISAHEGNVHSLIEIINKGFRLSRKMASRVFNVASKKGFYRLSKIIYRTLDRQNHYHYYFNPFSSVSYGNLSIFKFSLNLKKSQKGLQKAFVSAVLKDHKNITDYYFDKLLKEGFQFNFKCINKALNFSVMKKSSEFFFYLLNKFIELPDLKFDYVEMFENDILSTACLHENYEAVKKIMELIITSIKNEQSSFNNSEYNVTEAFLSAALSGSIEICQYFLDNKFSIDFNQLSTSFDELSTVNEEIFSLMISNCNLIAKEQFLHLYFEPAIENKNYELVEFLLKQKILSDNALFIAVKNDNLKMVNLILKYMNEPSFINRSSEAGTALCMAVERNDLKIVETLLSIPSTNPGLTDGNGSTPLMLAFPNIELMNPILNFYGDKILSQTEQLHFLIKKTLHLFISDDPDANLILARLIKIKGINFNELMNGTNFLLFACKTKNVTAFKMLIELDNIDLNIYDPETGDTPLIISIKNGDDEIANILLKDTRTNINAKNYANQTALSVSILYEQDQFIDLLFSNERFNPIESCLDYTFVYGSIDYQMKVLSTKWFDVNHLMFEVQKQQFNQLLLDDSINCSNSEEKKYSETVLNFAVRTNIKEIVDFIIKHPDFDKEKSDLKSAIFTTIKNDNFELFKKLLYLLKEEINDYEFNHNSLLFNIIDYKRIDMVKEILKHPNFDSKKNRFFDDFCSNFDPINHNSYEIMKILYEYDQEHDHLIDLNKLTSFGETVFTSINYSLLSKMSDTKQKGIDDIVHFLIDKGADPNVPNKDDKYPLQHAIELKSIDFVSALIKSNKIDFSRRIKSINNSTFFHLAAISKSSSILNEFIEKDVIDINSTDDLGETPLMYASRFRRKKNVKRLFEVENLDFLHANNEGKDALQITVEFSGDQNEPPKITDKNLYCRTLLKCFKNIRYLPFNVSKEKVGNFIPFLSPSEYENVDRTKKKNSKNDILHFVDNSSPALSGTDALNGTSDSYYDSQSGYHIEKNHSSTFSEDDEYDVDSSVKDSSAFDGISSLERNTKDKVQKNLHHGRFFSSSQKVSTSTSGHLFSIGDIISNNEDGNKSQQKSQLFDTSSSEKGEFNLTCLPSLDMKQKIDHNKVNFESHSNSQDIDKSTEKTVSDYLNDSSNGRDRLDLTVLPSLQSKEKVNKNQFTSNEKDVDSNEITHHPLNHSKSASHKNSNTSEKVPKVKEPDKPGSNHLPLLDLSPRSSFSRIRKLQSRSDEGDADASYWLGICYSLGKGVSIDKEKAFHYYLLAADRGHMNAQYSAASCYSYGKGTDVDKEKAFELYLKSAAQGFDKAQFAVGHFYEYGQGGVEKNHEKAVEWYRKAADQGHEGSIKALSFK
ncbi:hypothetical protein M9Y10_040035 [Tritrichomonas musculus]|uniref:Ankyrin repeat protein n=1 Tax=Tritrichomonas musculus TaxID=1915356 RepID=A0ABR2GQ93_9EUKA